MRRRTVVLAALAAGGLVLERAIEEIADMPEDARGVLRGARAVGHPGRGTGLCAVRL